MVDEGIDESNRASALGRDQLESLCFKIVVVLIDLIQESGS